MNEIKVVIADDEELARQLLSNLVGEEAGLSIVGEAASGDDALRLIRQSTPDLVFLDIRMPGVDGIELASVLGEMPSAPLVVFVTAFNDYATRAFDLEALDYLVKPIERSRFRQTIQRAKNAIRSRTGLPDESQNGSDAPGRFVTVKHRDELVRIPESEIFWLEAASQYVRIHTATKHYIVAESLNNYHARLEQERFVRVHRSAVVNIAQVARVLKKRHGVHELQLMNGIGVPLSRSRKQMVGEFLELCASRSKTVS